MINNGLLEIYAGPILLYTRAYDYLRVVGVQGFIALMRRPYRQGRVGPENKAKPAAPFATLQKAPLHPSIGSSITQSSAPPFTALIWTYVNLLQGLGKHTDTF